MKALLLTEYRQFEIVDMPLPTLGSHDVLVKIEACGICGSDVHGFDGSSGRRIPPIVMGHEAAGTIAAVGDQVSSVEVGERVTFDSTISCGACPACLQGAINLCTERRVIGVSCDDYRQHGAFAEFIAIPDRIVYPIPDDLPTTQAAMVEPVSVAVHAVRRLRVAAGETAVVVGAGMIGSLVIQTLKHVGCENILAVDLSPHRLALAQQLGATHAINDSEQDAAEQILSLTRDSGVDVAFEAVGSESPLLTAIASVRRGGRVGLIGNLQPRCSFPLQSIVTREIELIGSCASSGEYPTCIEWMANGTIDVQPLITATAPLEDGPSWFDRLYHREPDLAKILLCPTNESH